MTANSQDEQGNKLQAAGGVASGRRRLLRLGAGSVPVLMAFASRSAFACHSTTPSAFGSVCASRPELLKSSNGQSPSWWRDNSNWPKPYYSADVKNGKKVINKATTFQEVFCSTGARNPFGSSATLLSVLNSSSSGEKGAARACVAALLNARSGRTPSSIMTVSDVVAIWHQYGTKGYFEPTAGIQWHSDSPPLPYINGSNTGNRGGIIGYLNTTWT
jgi:hypothetical protein